MADIVHETQDEKKSRLAKEKKQRDLNNRYDSIAEVLETGLNTIGYIRDPASKYVLITSLLVMVPKMSLIMMKAPDKDEKEDIVVDNNIMKRYENQISRLDALTKDLIDWVQLPTYNPDHPLGNQMMNESHLHFDSTKEKEFIKKISDLEARVKELELQLISSEN
jgi:hypothetical protein